MCVCVCVCVCVCMHGHTHGHLSLSLSLSCFSSFIFIFSLIITVIYVSQITMRRTVEVPETGVKRWLQRWVEAVSHVVCYFFFFNLQIGWFCYTLHFNLSLVILLRLTCSILMPCQLPLLWLSTFCVCKLWWKSVMLIFFFSVMLLWCHYWMCMLRGTVGRLGHGQKPSSSELKNFFLIKMITKISSTRRQAEVLGGLRDFLSKDRPEHHNTNHLKERGMDIENHCPVSLLGSEWSVLNRTWAMFQKQF